MTQRARREPVYLPVSTYRLQLNRLFTFQDAAGVVDYLHALGISDCYTSPFLSARPGSLHGYDITDHGTLNPEIGSEEDFRLFADRLRENGMSLIADVVPNHMCITESSNGWWWDVLENGPSSPYARFFDIDWHPPKPDLINKVLLPFLGDQYGRVLENQQIAAAYVDGSFLIRLYTSVLPLGPRSWALILEPVLVRLRPELGPENEHTLELESIVTALSHLPMGTEIDEAAVRERQREKEVVKRRLAALCNAHSAVMQAIDESLRALNGKRGDPRSFDDLERLLEQQFYRLSYWRVAADEINYRRFFDINELAAIRVEDPQVFSAVHARILDWVKQGTICGLRVDHPDGLLDPDKYFRDLQNACSAARGFTEDNEARPFYIVSEKIVTGDEELRNNWSIEGTTGYGFLNFLNGIFVDRSKKRAFQRLYRSFTGWSQSYGDLIYDSKRLVLQVSMSSELNVLARRLDRISEQHRWSRDFTLENLRDALRETVTCFPIYRTYIADGAVRPDAEDERHIRSAIASAKWRNRAMDESVFDFIQNLLLLEDPGGLSESQQAERRLFVMRFQQFTGPVMAKGLEDTAFYRYLPLASLNDVGGDPAEFGTSLNVFHAKSIIRRTSWPHAMVTSSTHDSKRSEDVRARINVLSEIPAEWYRAVRSWQALNRSRKTLIAGIEAPSSNEEYLFYQTLIGVWPLDPMKPDEREQLVNRLQGYMEKALREAKVHTSWINPNAAYEEAVRGFVSLVLDPATSAGFLAALAEFHKRVERAGLLNALSQVLLKVASPGVPDFYQGNELWSFKLVDPDNRHPVDFELRRSLLRKISVAAGEDTRRILEDLLDHPSDGAIKLFITARALHFRRAQQDLFEKGSYLPLRASGRHQNHVVGFARVLNGRGALAVAGRYFTSLGYGEGLRLRPDAWSDSLLHLRAELGFAHYRDIFTGRRIAVETQSGKSVLPLSQVFATMPVALLEGE